MHAYRAYAVAHPARYASVPADPLHDPALLDAARRQLAVIQTAGGFGLTEDVDDSFHRMVDAFVGSIPGLATNTT